MNFEQRNEIESYGLRCPPIIGWVVSRLRYITGKFAGFNLLLVVDPEGSIICFHYVCPHNRAGVLAWPGQGTLGNLVSKYHGWDGQLKSARDFDNRTLCAAHSELKKIQVETWGPWLLLCTYANT